MSITSVLAKRVTNYDDPKSFASRLRAKRIVVLKEMIEAIFSIKGQVSIIDVGGTQKYWNILPGSYLADRNVTITAVNLPNTELPRDDGAFRFVHGDGCNLTGFADNSFDIAHSNSVVEHVGDWTRMVSYSTEIQRISESYYVQTPAFWFPVEPHCMTPFFHWLPKPIRVWLVQRFKLGHWRKAGSVSEAVSIVESARLLGKAMFLALFAHGCVRTERLLVWPKSYVAYQCRHLTNRCR